MPSYKEVTFIDPLSTTKIVALLGVLWAILAWVLDGIALTVFLTGQTESLTELPTPFGIGALVSGIIGGFLGGAISGYLGCLVYNLLTKKLGGIKVEVKE